MVEQAPGIEEAESAALALERAVGAPPRVATPAYLDEVGAATLALERALGDVSFAVRGGAPRRRRVSSTCSSATSSAATWCALR